jgi:molybdate transport system permease protein
MTTRQITDRSPRGFVVAAAVGVALVALPLIGLLTKVEWSRFLSLLGDSVVRDALWLSIVTSIVATLLAGVCGIPLAWALARGTWRGRTVVRSLVLVPLVIPPVVGGVALLSAFGRTNGLVGEPLYSLFGIQFTFSLLGVVLAQSFVALPFLTLALEGAFASIGRASLDFAASCGAGPWRRLVLVVLPSVRPAVVGGFAVAWARALGEFGATVTFAGNIEGRTQTVPLAVYSLLETNAPAAYALSALLLLVCVAVLVALRGRWLGGIRP